MFSCEPGRCISLRSRGCMWRVLRIFSRAWLRLFGLPRSIEGLIIIGGGVVLYGRHRDAEFCVSIGIDGDCVHAAMDHEAAAGIVE